MDFTEYQEKAFSTCTPECYTDEYLNLGYLSEVGELAGKLAKRVRGDVVSDEAIMHEIGDCAWMCAVHDLLHSRVVVDVFSTFTIYDELHGIRELLDAGGEDRFGAVRVFCEYLGFDFHECLRLNIEKLSSRQKRGVIQGDGDNR